MVNSLVFKQFENFIVSDTGEMCMEIGSIKSPEQLRSRLRVAFVGGVEASENFTAIAMIEKMTVPEKTLLLEWLADELKKK